MEELKLILEALASLGAAGKEAFIWWLVVAKIVQPAMILAGVIAVTWIIVKAVGKFNDEHAALDTIAKELGMRWFWSGSNDEDYNIRGLIKRLDKLKAKKGT